MPVLVLYASLEGQTEKIARFAAEHARKLGQDVTLGDVTRKAATVDLAPFDTVILAAPVHERRHPETFEVFLASERAALAERRTLLLSVSLSAAFPEGREEAQDYLTEMEMRTNFEPTVEALVAGALHAAKYDYFARQLVRHVVLRGHDHDPNDDEHEFTDWSALAATVKRFVTGAPALG